MRSLGKLGLTLAVGIGIAIAAAGCDNGERAPAREPSNPPQRAFTDPGAAGPQSIGPNREEAKTATVVPPPMMDIDRSFAGKNEQQAQSRGGGQTQAKTEQPLTDGQVLGIALAANEGEVNMAEMAIKKGNNTEVKQFAAMMKSHHGTGVQKTKALVTKTRLETADSDVSQQLKDDVSKVVKDLHDKGGRAFDRAYMDAQVKAHKDVLLAIDSRMIPSVTNGEVKTFLVDMRKTVADHLLKAETLAKSVDQPATTSLSTDRH